MQVASLFSRDRETSLSLLELLGSLSLISRVSSFAFLSSFPIYVAKLSEWFLGIEGILYAGSNENNNVPHSVAVDVEIIDQFANDFQIIILENT